MLSCQYCSACCCVTVQIHAMLSSPTVGGVHQKISMPLTDISITKVILDSTAPSACAGTIPVSGSNKQLAVDVNLTDKPPLPRTSRRQCRSMVAQLSEFRKHERPVTDDPTRSPTGIPLLEAVRASLGSRARGSISNMKIKANKHILVSAWALSCPDES